MNNKAQTIETYNRTARAMADKFDNLGSRVEDVRNAFSFVEKENPNVFEIGCANGRDAKEIVTRTDSYLGIDLSEAMIGLAREYVPEASFEIADFEEYVFPSGIDVIFAFASLLHSDQKNVERILHRAHNCLNENGIFYISLKHGEYQSRDRIDKLGTRTFYYYTPKIIREIIVDRYVVIDEDIQELDQRDRKWFTIVLRKVTGKG